MNPYELGRLISRLRRWVSKRQKKNLECAALAEAIGALEEYRQLLVDLQLLSDLPPEERRSA